MNNYTKERAQLILLSLLKQNGIRNIIASPGSTNISFVVSAQHDSFFKLYSAPDERSAAYMACGMAETLNEPVVITCTGATASRNYLPALTEAYYRKLPVIAITAITSVARRHHLFPQIIDRSNPPADSCRFHATLPTVKDEESAWECNFLVNKAVAETTRNGGGPVILEIQTNYLNQFADAELPVERTIKFNTLTDKEHWPELKSNRTAIFVGSHRTFSDRETQIIHEFCEVHNAVVFCDHTSGYNGTYRVNFSLVNLLPYKVPERDIDVLIHIGEVSGDYYGRNIFPKQVWRVSEDGEMRDTFGKLTEVFQCNEYSFFSHYSQNRLKQDNSYLDTCIACEKFADSLIPDIPFSNIWCAKTMAPVLPKNSTLHLAILNTLRSWNFFAVDPSIIATANVGGFGIDGPVSTSIGAALANPSRINTLIAGDLAFFYDVNSLGNRHLPPNLRIMLINNGKGVEFRNKSHIAAAFGEEADDFVAAANHYGAKSVDLVRHFAQDLGLSYFSASNKEEFRTVLKQFTSSIISKRPILFEVFVDWKDDQKALDIVQHLDHENAPHPNIAQQTLGSIKKMIGPKAIEIIRTLRR